MGRVKEILLKREYREMDKLPNENLKEYLLTIESEYKPQAYEQDNYYLIKYYLLDLRSLETLTISETIPKDSLEQEIPKPLAIILHETNHHVKTYDRFSYKALINNGWISNKYIFEAIPMKESISSLNDLLILPSNEKAIIHYLSRISYHLDNISSTLEEQRGDIETNLNNIKNELDLMNYLAQG